jgi:opacity protein-like surface antigen
MKKTMLLSSIPVFLLAATSGFANGTVFDGFYFGGSAGGAFVTAEPKISVSDVYTNRDQGGPFNTVLNANDVLKKNAFKGGIFAGYGKSWDVWYLGMEAFVNYENFTESDTFNSNGSTEFSEPNPSSAMFYNTTVYTNTTIDPFQVGVDVRPGFLLTPTTLLYMRFGSAFSTIKMNTETTFYGASVKSNPESFATTLTDSQSKSVMALRAGAGLEQHLTNQWSIRADYVFTYYGKLSTDGFTPVKALPSGNTYQLSSSTSGNKVMDNAVLLSISYALHC